MPAGFWSSNCALHSVSSVCRSTECLVLRLLDPMAVRNSLLRTYGVGLACTFAGAWVTGLSDSFIPLAMGAAVAVMCTFHVVRAICSKPVPPAETGSSFDLDGPE